MEAEAQGFSAWAGPEVDEGAASPLLQNGGWMRRRVDASGNRRKELRPLAFTFPTRGRLGRIHPNFSLLGFSAALAPKFDTRDSKSALCPKHFQEPDHTCAKVPSSALESGSAAARAWARPRGEGGSLPRRGKRRGASKRRGHESRAAGLLPRRVLTLPVGGRNLQRMLNLPKQGPSSL